MSLEQRVESLEKAIIKLTDVISAGGLSSGAATADTKSEDTKSEDTKSEDKGASAAKAKAAAAAKAKADAAAKAKAKVEPEHTLEQLKALLQEYKTVFGLPEAKKLLPGLGYENSNAVPADKIDEVYEHVSGLISKAADDGAL